MFLLQSSFYVILCRKKWNTLQSFYSCPFSFPFYIPDTSFSEFCLKQPTSEAGFCLKQSTSEAELLLIENFSSFDNSCEFIDKFLSYKEFLSSDVLEIAFQAWTSAQVTGNVLRHSGSGVATTRDTDANVDTGFDGSAKGGKKKGKKGKKVSLLVLGFKIL